MNAIVLGDWGTSRLRLFLLDSEGAVDRRVEGPGIGAVFGTATDALAVALTDLGAQVDARVMLSGMAGARDGLIEAPYVKCPADAAGWARAAARTTLDARAVTVAAGMRCVNFAGAPDVMRGEETQIFGAVAQGPSLARGRHVIVLPGTHSKWALIAGGMIERFHTFATGELFALLHTYSTLLRAGDRAGDAGGGFEAGLARGRAGAGLAASLFETRAAQLLDGRGAAWAADFLSGLLIADEVRTALGLVGGPEMVTLIGDPGLCARYALALGGHEVSADVLDGDACALAGLRRLAAT